jgi:hypothetical protein
MGEQSIVREVPEAGAVVGHDVGVSGDVGEAGEVAIVPLVKGLEAKQVRRGAGGSGGALGLPGKGGGVVSERMDGALATINLMDKDVVLSNGAGELKVRVGDGPRGVVITHEIALDGERERSTPEKGGDGTVLIRDKEHASHARSGSIRGANGTGGGVNYFTEAGGPGVEVADEPTEVIKEVMHLGGQPDTPAGLVAKGFLEEAEEAPQARDG